MCTPVVLFKPTYLFVLAHPGGDSSFLVLLPLSLSQEYVPRSLLVPVTFFPVIFASVPFFTHFFTCNRWQS